MNLGKALEWFLACTVAFVFLLVMLTCFLTDACSSMSWTTCFQLTTGSTTECRTGFFILAGFMFFLAGVGGVICMILVTLLFWPLMTSPMDTPLTQFFPSKWGKGYIMIVLTLSMLALFYYGVFFKSFYVNGVFVGVCVIGGLLTLLLISCYGICKHPATGRLAR